jgi:hypothetical protein
VIEWVPTLSADVLKVATPLALSVPVPSGVAPSRNVTGPVGVPVPDAVTVTAWPKVDGLTLEASVVVVA